jgi:radical SAM superfamily enzyme YgiQ (UPF0313 family)
MIGKGITAEQVRNAFRAAQRTGVANIEADFMLGVHPSERSRDIEATEDLISEIQPDTLFVSVAVPYPGTRLWEIMQEDGLIQEDADWEDFLMYAPGDAWRTRHFSTLDLRRKQREILKRFYFSPRHILRTMRKAQNADELFYYLKSGMSFLLRKRGGIRNRAGSARYHY